MIDKAPAVVSNWTAIARHTIADGVVRQMVHGDRLMVCRLTLQPGTTTTAHRHPHEQITVVERGRVRFTIGTDERLCGPGDVIVLPGGVWHGCTLLGEEAVLVDIFSPIREDFLEPAGDATDEGQR
jgi:quercetin dioxygenase-like cupin family protein